MKITDIDFLCFPHDFHTQKQRTIQNTKKYVKIKLSQKICQNDIINDIIIKFSKFRIFCIFSLL